MRSSAMKRTENITISPGLIAHEIIRRILNIYDDHKKSSSYRSNYNSEPEDNKDKMNTTLSKAKEKAIENIIGKEMKFPNLFAQLVVNVITVLIISILVPNIFISAYLNLGENAVGLSLLGALLSPFIGGGAYSASIWFGQKMVRPNSIVQEYVENKYGDLIKNIFKTDNEAIAALHALKQEATLLMGGNGLLERIMRASNFLSADWRFSLPGVRLGSYISLIISIATYPFLSAGYQPFGLTWALMSLGTFAINQILDLSFNSFISTTSLNNCESSHLTSPTINPKEKPLQLITTAHNGIYRNCTAPMSKGSTDTHIIQWNGGGHQSIHFS